MLKIVEIKETTDNTELIDNIYKINSIIKNIIGETEFIFDLNRDDYNYINIVLGKIRKNLDITYTIIKKNSNK